MDGRSTNADGRADRSPVLAPVIESCQEAVTDETIHDLITLGVIARNARGRPG
jgi:hypothetical protein